MIRSLAFAALIACPTLAHAQMQPGQWQFHINVTSFDMPAAPPAAAAAFKKPVATTRCITPAEAQSGPLEMMKKRDGWQCTFRRQSMTDGKFDAELVCDRPDNTVTATIAGSFSATTLAMTIASEQTGERPVKMTTVTTAERVGDCK